LAGPTLCYLNNSSFFSLYWPGISCLPEQQFLLHYVGQDQPDFLNNSSFFSILIRSNLTT
jgi:hypothetical protein